MTRPLKSEISVISNCGNPIELTYYATVEPRHIELGVFHLLICFFPYYVSWLQRLPLPSWAFAISRSTGLVSRSGVFRGTKSRNMSYVL